MIIGTGKTVYKQILSLDIDSNPVTGATFDCVLYVDNIEYTGSTPTYSLTDATRGIFTFSWSAETIGMYQLYIKNNTTGVVFISDTVRVAPDSEFDTTVYVGL